jgi:Ni,Fe-hydrogenase III component G
MSRDQDIRQELATRFPSLAETVRVQRSRRVWAEVAAPAFREVFTHAVQAMGFSHLCTITGLDEGENLSFLYHLAHAEGVLLTLKTSVPKSAPVMPSIGDLFPGGAIYERELVDLLGAKFDGLPPGKRYPLPDGWPEGQHPLRKDWTPENLPASSLTKP